MEKQLNFDDYIEVSEKGKVIGFRLEGDPFLYRFDKRNGWYDAKGNYYNSDAQKCNPPDSSDDEEAQTQAKEASEDAVMHVKLQTNTQRQEAIRDLLEIIESYPEDQLVEVNYEDDKNTLKDNDINKLLQQKSIKAVFKDAVIHVDKKIATELTELQGTKLNASTIYIYIRLYNSSTLQLTFQKNINERELIVMLQDLELEKNKDFANIEANSTEVFVQISKKYISTVSDGVKCVKVKTL